jgi:hypothetical protein
VAPIAASAAPRVSVSTAKSTAGLRRKVCSARAPLWARRSRVAASGGASKPATQRVSPAEGAAVSAARATATGSGAGPP